MNYLFIFNIANLLTIKFLLTESTNQLYELILVLLQIDDWFLLTYSINSTIFICSLEMQLTLCNYKLICHWILLTCGFVPTWDCVNEFICSWILLTESITSNQFYNSFTYYVIMNSFAVEFCWPFYFQPTLKWYTTLLTTNLFLVEFCWFWVGIWKGTKVAIKKIHYREEQPEEILQDFMQEASLMRWVNKSQHILRTSLHDSIFKPLPAHWDIQK
jgi:hypothetical protein